MLDVLPNDTASPDRETLEKDLTKHIQRALNALETREAMVLRLFFGFDTHPPQSLSAIGKKLDLSRERVRQIKKQALDRLNHPKRRTPLEDFLDTH